MQFNFPDNVKLLSTPRYLQGGASKGGYGNFNLATHTGDNLDVVAHNRELLITHFDLPNTPKWLNQIHSNICLDAQSNDCEGDAVITRETNVICAVMTADCLPIFASNQSGTQVGVAHAGWQGILNGVIESFIEQFIERDLLIHFGAAISSKNLEVGKEVFEQFATKDKKLSVAFTQIGEKYHLDIYQAARIILNDLGIKTMSGGNQCTAEQDKDYFSYRRDGVNSGRMAHLIWITT
ncbi:FIG00003370: Multicopper polyphenol oxidase [uncultured Gammaproteobacteria bacterium]|jgi:YfiH family protein|nr:FIG00003370: Multicopper polyphenol oxidase [uncultured Gammaproteobacteria bacterium]